MNITQGSDTVAKKKKAKAAKRKPARKVKKKKAGSKRRGGGLTQMSYCVSESLQAVVGAKCLTRPQIVKKMWVYIKGHKLQDARNRRMINPDNKLAAVIGKKPVDMLKLATHINKHIKKK